jgi:hypothetical protein
VSPFQLHRRIPVLRRRFDRLDRALAELSLVTAERNALRELTPESAHTWFRHRPASHLAGRTSVTRVVPIFDDAALIERIIRAYQAANTTALGAPDSFWLQTIADMKRPIHDILMSGDAHAAERELRNPAENMLFYGFDSLMRERTHAHDADWEDWARQWTYDNLLRLTEAVGVRRIEYPEGTPQSAPPDPEALLRELDDAFGFAINFPNPFAGEVGLETSRGVASYRSIQALYQAFRIRQLSSPGSKVLEIGAGLGRTAYYATQFGFRDYTIVDLPITNVAQAYFLGRSLGETSISLFQEDNADVRVLPPSAFLESQDHYSLIVNVDSMTEMGRDTAKEYCRAIKSRAAAFLSINHEFNPLTVQDICREVGLKRLSRTPYWLRRGYVDEIFN